MKNWYWHKENDTEPRGPVSLVELKDLVKNGDLSRVDKIWKEGFDDWVLAATVSDIFSAPPPIKTRTVTPTEITDGSKSLSAPNYPPKVKKEEKSDQNKSLKGDSDNGLKGVGGWLFFFCFLLIVINPLVGIGQSFNGWVEISPAFNQYPVLESAMWIETLTIYRNNNLWIFRGDYDMDGERKWKNDSRKVS